MSNHKNFRVLLVFGSILLLALTIFFFLPRAKSKEHSLLLYTSFPSNETTINWVVNMDTGEQWQVGNNNMEAGHWSPSGKYISLYTYLPNVTINAIWVSDSLGNNLRQIFDGKDYPDIKVRDFRWLTDKIILVNVFDNKNKASYVYTLNVETGAFEAFDKGYVLSAASQGEIWLHRGEDSADTINYYIMNLKGEHVLTSIGLLDAEYYFFSPDGESWAYFCERDKTSYISLCLADVSVNGIENERKIISQKREPDAQNAQYMRWSQDGKYIGFHIFNQNIKKTRFHAIDAATGTTIYDWVYPTITYADIWSPHNDQVIDQNGILLDLKTGQVYNFFDQIHETAPSYIVDWRMIEVP